MVYLLTGIDSMLDVFRSVLPAVYAKANLISGKPILLAGYFISEFIYSGYRLVH
jgi:hypothetical protein